MKSLDFSSYSANHKEQLWKTLSDKNDRRVLLEHELSFAAAGILDLITEDSDFGLDRPDLITENPDFGLDLPGLGKDILEPGMGAPKVGVRICAICGSKNVSSKGLCADCRHLN